ncbi:PIN domain-containing protein [Methanosarcina sp.]|jgi:predicted nucleic acid-binding protein|uniref:PIN domain-containing protein n=1 Tax=Methanosarcina sp. TaxID=2213 RepID=UPI003BB4CFBC
MSSRILVLDANILIRAVLGNKVRDLLIINRETIDFFTADVCWADAEKYLPILFEKRKLPSNSALTLLSKLKNIIQIADEAIYKEYSKEAQKRMKNRDIEDWPIAASALALDCPIWTEDKDFFGAGFSTWTTDKVHIFFEMI